MKIVDYAIRTTSPAIVRATIPAVVAFAFLLARRYIPPTPTVRLTRDEESRFAKLQWLVGVCMMLVGTAFGLCSYELLTWINRIIASHEISSRFLLLPTHWMWGVFPIFGGICITWELTLRLWMQFGNSFQARKYEAWSNSKAGFNASKVLRYMAVFIALPVGMLTALALPIHTSFNDESISIGHFASITPSVVPYSDVKAITVTDGLRTRDGGFISRAAIVIDFKSGDRWSSADNRDYEKHIDSHLLSFLQAKTGLASKHIEAYPFGAI